MRTPFRQHLASGQVLLVSVVVLGFVSLGFVVAGVTAIVEESQINTAITNKALAASAASGCMEQAINRLALNSAYSGNETVTVGTQSCTIRPIIVGSGIWTIQTSAQAGDQYARYQVVLSSRSPVTISSWSEVSSF